MEVDVLKHLLVAVAQGSLLDAHPPKHLLLHHLDQSLRVHRVDVNVSLQPPKLDAPRKWLAHHTVRSELCQTFVHSVEDALVQDVLTLLDDRHGVDAGSAVPAQVVLYACRQLLCLCLVVPLSQLEFVLSVLFNVEVSVNGQDRVLEWVDY